jgi:putative NADH-flavin reductase
MSRILVIGARGRAGKAAVAEARERGHEVIGVARTAADDPGRSAQTMVGDVTDARRIAELALGCDAVIAAVYDGGSDPSEFYPRAARALVEGLEKAGVRRLVWVGLASILPTSDGALLMDTEGYPNEFRSFFLAHQTAQDIFAASSLDWVSVAPSGDFDHADPARVGRYRVTPANAVDRISYVDLAAVLVDEIDRPAYHREAIGVAV